jgi:hypothetical protein
MAAILSGIANIRAVPDPVLARDRRLLATAAVVQKSMQRPFFSQSP